MKKILMFTLLSVSAVAVNAHGIAKHSDEEKALLRRSIITPDEHRDAPPEVIEAAAYVASQTKKKFQAPPGYAWTSGESSSKNTHVFVPRTGKGAVIKIGKAKRAIVYGQHGSQRFEAPEAFVVSEKPVRVIPEAGHTPNHPFYGAPNDNLTKFMRWLTGKEYMFTAPDQVAHRVAIARSIHEQRDKYPAVDAAELWLAPFADTQPSDPIDDEHYAVLSTFIRATQLGERISEQDQEDLGTLLADVIRIARDFMITDLHFGNVLITRTAAGRLKGCLIDAEDLFRDATLNVGLMKRVSGMHVAYLGAQPFVPKKMNPLLRAGLIALTEDRAKRQRYAMNLLLHHAHFLGFFIPWPHLGKKKLKDLEWLQNTFTKLGSWHQRSILKKLRKYNPDKITVSFDEYRDGNIDYQIEKAHDEQIQHAIKHHPKDLIATALGRRFHERKAAAYRAKIRKYAIGSVLGAGALGTAGWAGRRFLIK